MTAKRSLILLPIFLSCVLSFSKNVNIAGLFDQDESIKRSFELSVEAVNTETHENKKEFSKIFFTPNATRIETDVFEVTVQVCELVSLGVVGIFGPQDKVMAEHVQSICDTLEIPHISVRQDPEESPLPRGVGLNLYPHAGSLSRVYDQLVTEFEWKTFAILYENTEGLARLHLLLKRWDAHGHSAFVYHLGDGPSYRETMQKVKESEIENVVIDCSHHYVLNEVLRQAQQVGILSDKHKVIVTSLDLQSLDLEPYQFSGVNFTGVRLIDPEDPIVEHIVWKHQNVWDLDDSSKLQVEPALMYDAVQMFAQAFKQLKNATKVDVKELQCNGNERWEHGLSLSNFMRSMETRGLTGLIKFDRDGFRSNIQLDIVRLTEDGLMKIGEWNSTSSGSIEWMADGTKTADVDQKLQNKTFIVLISLTAPYGMQKESWMTLSGNDRYEGFGIDIIDEISKILEFNYTLQVEQSDYGSYNPIAKQWSGMLGKIMAGEADLAITDLTITSEREGAVDFTKPFMNLGISILYRKSRKAPPSLFSFLSPFSNDVWLYLIGSYIVVSLLLFVIGRLCPAEWNNPYPCIEDAEELENQFTCKNAFWFAIGSIMQQGSEIAPIGISTRTLAGIWYFFCLIMVSSYTANLAAFLTVETVTAPFDNIEELVRKKTIKYGAKHKGSTITFFKESNYSVYQEMYKYMMDNEKDVLPEKNEDALEKVKHEDYAFLMESSSIEYIMERECNVTQIGGLLDEKGYGIAMIKGSPYRIMLDTAVLKLSESGKLTELKKKWWTQKRGGGKCRENGGGGSAGELDLSNVGGVFLVLTVGVALSCVYTVCELLWAVFRMSIRDNVSFKEELMNEIKFIAKCSSSKPARRRNESSSKSGDGSTRGCTPPYGFVPTVITTSPTDDK